MRLVHNVSVTTPKDKNVKLTIEVWQRPNSDASVWIIQYKGRRITPYEQRLRGWSFGLNALFSIIYGDKIKDLIPDYNPFYKLIPKNETTGQLYFEPIRLREGIE
jgi:hypothetical protein